MRALATIGVLAALALGASSGARGMTSIASVSHKSSKTHAARTMTQRATSRLLASRAFRTRRARPGRARAKGLLSPLELDIVARMNAMRGARGLRPLRVSRGLTVAAGYHTRQMGQLGFFEHESANGAPFWRRLERFYPAGRRYWSVGENLFFESPETTASSAVHEWMMSPGHRENILGGEFREVGVAAVHYDSAPGTYRSGPVTIVTADFGVRR